MDKLKVINNRIGYTYNFPVRMGGFLVAAIGVVLLLANGWGLVAGSILILAGLYFAVTGTGILIDPINKSVQHYTSIYGLRKGTWREYPTYNHICVIRKDRKKKGFFEAPVDIDSESPYQFEVHLVSRSFRGKVLLEICYDRETAEFRASRYAEDMTAMVAEYNPPGKTRTKGERKPHRGYRNKHQSDGFEDED